MTAHDPHIVESIKRMKQTGVGNAEIAMSVGLTEGAVKALCSKRGIRRRDSHIFSYSVKASIMEAVRAEAHRRDVSIPILMRNLISVVVRDNLFAAIIDDGK